MELALILVKQVLMMFFIMALGVVFIRSGKITREGIIYITNILLYLILPSILINAFQTDFTMERLRGILVAIGLALIAHIIFISLNTFVFLRNKKSPDIGLQQFCAIYSNAGYIAFPLIEATFGSEGVFYAAAYMMVFNIFMWTHGAYVLHQDVQKKNPEIGKYKVNFKAIFLAPGVLFSIIGFLLFILRIRLPIPFGPALKSLSTVNTPLALVVSGFVLAYIDPVSIFNNAKIYWICFIRNLLTPIIVMVVFFLIGAHRWVENGTFIVVVSMISVACPTAQSSGFFATKMGANGEYGARVIAFTTLFSIITVPLIAMISAELFGLVL